ncbi:hypothetical protein ACLBWS_13780, partial [Brucellaceae bacterium D45D]
RRTASRSNSFVKGTRFVIKVSFQLKKTSPLFPRKSNLTAYDLETYEIKKGAENRAPKNQ